MIIDIKYKIYYTLWNIKLRKIIIFVNVKNVY